MVERFGARRFQARRAKLLNQVSSRQSLVYALVVIQLTARADSDTCFINDTSGQWDIAGYDHVARLHQLHNCIVRDVGTIAHGDPLNEVGLWDGNRLIGH